VKGLAGATTNEAQFIISAVTNNSINFEREGR